MTTSLSQAQVAQYRRDGYLCPLTALSTEQAARYRAYLEAAEAAAGGSLPGPYRHKPHLVYGWAQELIRQPAILDAVEGIIGPDILAWETVFFTKEPGTSDFISWHQDITYWGLEAEGDVVTACVALSPSTTLSGCMRVVPGTHRREVVPQLGGEAGDVPGRAHDAGQREGHEARPQGGAVVRPDQREEDARRAEHGQHVEEVVVRVQPDGGPQRDAPAAAPILEARQQPLEQARAR